MNDIAYYSSRTDQTIQLNGRASCLHGYVSYLSFVFKLAASVQLYGVHHISYIQEACINLTTSFVANMLIFGIIATLTGGMIASTMIRS